MSPTYVAPASRLAPCPCGSGRRWKECHGGLAATPDLSLAAALAQALAAQQAKRHSEAEALYRHALSLAPGHFDALHMLGVARLMQGDLDEALALIERALDVLPTDAGARFNRALVEKSRDWWATQGAYAHWVARVDTPDASTLERWRRDHAQRANRPLLSLVMPTYNSPERWLVDCLDSVLAQINDHWELCIADDASPDPAVRRVLDAYAAREPRIRVAHRDRNGHISAASNSALALARGPFIALLDHDDLLPPQALHFVAAAIEQQPDAVLLYSDEDKIDASNRRFDPYFKPDWNIDLMAAQNCVSHFGIYRTETVRAVGGFREGYEGAQDWDLALRVARTTTPARIVHIPRILYHWRAIEGSTAQAMSSKDYAALAQDRVVADHFAARSEAMTLARVVKDTFIEANPSGPPPAFALVVAAPAEIGVETIRATWCALAPEARSVEVVTTAARLDTSGWPMALDVAAAIDRAVARAEADIVIVVDASLVPDAGALALLAAHANRSGAGVIGGQVRNRNGQILHAGYMLDPEHIAVPAYAGKSPGCMAMGARVELVQTLSAVGQGVLAARRQHWAAAGGLAAAPVTHHFRDVDLCLRIAAAGARTVWHPRAAFESSVRIESPAGSMETLAADALAMRQRWGPLLAADPAGNPNLAAMGQTLDLAPSPRLPAHLT